MKHLTKQILDSTIPTMLVLSLELFIISVRYGGFFDVESFNQLLPYFKIETPDKLMLLNALLLCLERRIWR